MEEKVVTRRTALKIMGSAALATVMATTGTFSWHLSGECRCSQYGYLAVIYEYAYYDECLTMGLVFELPVIIWLLSRMGIVSSGFLRKYRRHAIVTILVIAAVITPTSDIFTLLLVSLPMYTLYEISILISKQKK